jgi:hypothetical protein
LGLGVQSVSLYWFKSFDYHNVSAKCKYGAEAASYSYLTMLLITTSLQKLAGMAGVDVYSPVSHTLYNPADVIAKVKKNLLSCGELLDNVFVVIIWCSLVVLGMHSGGHNLNDCCK